MQQLKRMPNIWKATNLFLDTKEMKATSYVWWRLDSNGKRVPNPGARKTTLRRNLTEAEARQFCQEYNATNPPGRLSVKAEYERD